MGLYIKEIGKPKCCHECVCHTNFTQDADGYGEYCDYCRVLKRRFNRSKLDIDPFKERLADCPLIEVKTPHGRLIDVEEMIQNHYIYHGRNFMMFGEMNKAPTVIEAEVE